MASASTIAALRDSAVAPTGSRTGLSLHVVGARFPNPKRRGKPGVDRQFEILLCAPGEPVELVPEPANKADEHAIAVYSCRGVQLGYVTAERAPWIGGMLAAGRLTGAVFQERTSFGAAIRVGLDGAEPVLPPAKAPAVRDLGGDRQLDAAADGDFYPDFIPPDDDDCWAS